MRKLLLLLMVFNTVISCDKTDDPDVNISAIDALLGEWTLQSRILNDVNSLQINTEQLIITDDNSLNNYKGKYQLMSDENSNGNFALNNRNATITFTSSTDETRTHRYFLNPLNIQLFIEQDNGDVITENWVRVVE
ncbi:hypothetical protein H8K90_00285 [Winogradskyella echinorum]|uniref:Lipocalin-like domain-containing protein n=1 Tax=Winogradskyella echinorum TaxID=538189 RepID=A0ABR6XWF1_9FLAO|nr:hypothetical protein [Winogradskyella echinorum]MBC3844802.1 hypothetical protein [Winogradskyella echinorum]MBC5749150.1 hypothetical protein [Winogradskyella echinorum]